jgi:hypothetical protein
VLTRRAPPDTIAQVADKNPQVTPSVMRSKRRDALSTHCLARAMIAANGWDESQAEFEAGTVKVSNWAAAKAAPKAIRVAGFIVAWAVAMRAEGREEYTITEYRRYWNEGERQTYRLQKEFRELWPEFETPNELARQIVRHADSKLETLKGKLPLAIPVLA